jgi:hypothetical protein
MPFVANVVIQQVGNPTPSTASVRISFTLTGILTDLVEIYAGGASDPISNPVQRVDISPPEINYTSDDIELQAGTEFFFHLCPRNKTGDRLDDDVENQPFETFCTAAIPFTTQGTAQSTVSPPPSPPRISSFVPHQPTLDKAGSVVVTWETTSGKCDKYHLIWTNLALGILQEFEIEVGGSSGASFSAGPTTAGKTYTFKVQSCIAEDLGPDNCSAFCADTQFVMPANTNSLRAFLQLSGVPPGTSIRSLGEAAFGAGLRAMMHL